MNSLMFSWRDNQCDHLPHKAPRGIRVVRDELVHNFFEDVIIPDSLMFVPDIEGHLPTKDHKKWNDSIPSTFFVSPHTS
jgi:hypothetical protein